MQLPLVLSHEFTSILDHLEYSSDNIFITGRAGTGKSTLLQIFRNTTKKRAVVLAPTGIAALNVNGQTIHSFFGFPPRLLNTKEIEKRRNNKIYSNLDIVIIDEISMVRADIIDNIDYFLQINRGNKLPFGGVQMIFFGDLFQLPPVVSSSFEKHYFATTYDTPYFFSSKVLATLFMRMVELHQVYRQDERYFIQLLDAIRLNRMEYDDFVAINERFVPVPEENDFFITLCSRNDIAKRINESKLASLISQPHEYTASIVGEFNPQLFPTEFNLILKENAQVMFVKNDLQKAYVNGTIGIVTELTSETIQVKIKDSRQGEKYITVEKQEWEILKYEINPNEKDKISVKVVGTFTQYPLKLAWAITIHKSQGKTFDQVIIDLGSGAFESGQTYVALSRCRTLDGIVLKQPLRNRDIIIDDRITEYYEQIKYLS